GLSSQYAGRVGRPAHHAVHLRQRYRRWAHPRDRAVEGVVTIESRSGAASCSAGFFYLRRLSDRIRNILDTSFVYTIKRNHGREGEDLVKRFLTAVLLAVFLSGCVPAGSVPSSDAV